MADAIKKYRMKVGNKPFNWRLSFVCRFLTMPNIKVIGIIANVRVSLTAVAKPKMLLWWIWSQARAVAVTLEVSFTAVPANKAKPALER